ncbi:MAG: bifunctional methylenetetrahydrofolate dehydrogenase/methenyltetrahydrofolate cyclohydrolase FolD [Clostridia bacterium]|nr:bifunctional methylenetetrahydrofolate dehydrogenase/methenyltetrahydrofolate cyclohydrolase FolD [Clostridia bacterium]
MAKIISGKEVSLAVKQEVADEVAQLKNEGIEPSLAVILVGNDPASKVYVNNKKKACDFCGIRSLEFLLGEETTQEELMELVERLNNDETVNGILCQLPLPKHLDEQAVLNAIKPQKDVDAFHPENVGHIMIGDYAMLPCTPSGIMEMFRYEGIELDGKNCVVIGRSNIVGKPMAMLMLKENATVTICHSHTENLKKIVSEADVVVAAVGIPKFVTADMIKDGAVVIDVGINRMEDGKLCGDVDYEACEKKASYITPVPGGVGPMTIATLMKNTVTAAKIQNKRGK